MEHNFPQCIPNIPHKGVTFQETLGIETGRMSCHISKIFPSTEMFQQFKPTIRLNLHAIQSKHFKIILLSSFTECLEGNYLTVS